MTGVVVGVRADSRQAEQDLRSLQLSLNRIEKSTSSISQGFLTLAKSISVAVTISGGLALLNKSADQFTNLGNKIALVTGRTSELLRVQRELLDITQRTRSSVDNTAETFNKLGLALSKSGKSTNQILKATEAIQQAVAISGSSAESARAAIVQLGQGLGSGTLRGEELNSVLEQTPRIALAIADGLNVSIAEMRALAAEGKLTSEVVFSSLLSQTDKLNSEFKQLSPTLQQSTTQIGQAITEFVSELDRGLGLSAAIGNGLLAKAKVVRSAAQDIGASAAVAGTRIRQGISDVTRVGSSVFEIIKQLSIQLGEFFPRFFFSRTIVYDAKVAVRELDDLFGGFFSGLGLGVIRSVDNFKSLIGVNSEIETAILRIKRAFQTVFFTGGLDPDTFKRVFNREVFIEFLQGLKDLGNAVRSNTTSIINEYRKLERSLTYSVRGVLRYLGLIGNAGFNFRLGNIEAFINSMTELTRGALGLNRSLLDVNRIIEDEFGSTWTQVGNLAQDVFFNLPEIIGKALGATLYVVYEFTRRLFVAFKQGLRLDAPIREAAGSVRDALADVANYVTTDIRKIFDSLASSSLADFPEKVRKYAVRAFYALQHLFNVLPAILGGTQSISQTWEELVSIMQTGQAVSTKLMIAWAALSALIVAPLAPAALTIKIWAGQIVGLIAAVEGAKKSLSFGEGFSMGINNLFEAALGKVKPLATNVLNILSDFKDKVIDYFADIYDKVIGNSYWTDLVDGVINTSKKMVKVAGKNIAVFAAGVVSAFAAVYIYLNGLVLVVSSIALYAATGAAAIGLIVTALKSAGVDTSRFEKGLANVGSKLEDVKKDIAEFGKYVINVFRNIYDKVIGNSWWTDTIDSVVSQTESLIPRVSKPLNEFASTVSDKFRNIFEQVQKIGKSGSFTFESKGDFVNAAKGLYESLMDSVHRFSQEFPTAMRLAILSAAAYIVTFLFPASKLAGIIQKTLIAAVSASALLAGDQFVKGMFGQGFLDQSAKALGEAAGAFAAHFIKSIPDILNALLTVISGFTRGFLTQLPIIGKAFETIFNVGGEGFSTALGLVGSVLLGTAGYKLLSKLDLVPKSVTAIITPIAKFVKEFKPTGAIAQALFGTFGAARIFAAIAGILTLLGSFDSLFQGSAIFEFIAKGGLLYILWTGESGVNRIVDTTKTVLAKVVGLFKSTFASSSGTTGLLGRLVSDFADGGTNRKAATKFARSKVEKSVKAVNESVLETGAKGAALLQTVMLGTNPQDTEAKVKTGFSKITSSIKDVIQKLINSLKGVLPKAVDPSAAKASFSSVASQGINMFSTLQSIASKVGGENGLVGKVLFGKAGKFVLIAGIVSLLALFTTSASAAEGSIKAVNAETSQFQKALSEIGTLIGESIKFYGSIFAGFATAFLLLTNAFDGGADLSKNIGGRFKKIGVGLAKEAKDTGNSIVSGLWGWADKGAPFIGGILDFFSKTFGRITDLGKKASTSIKKSIESQKYGDLPQIQPDLLDGKTVITPISMEADKLRDKWGKEASKGGLLKGLIFGKAGAAALVGSVAYATGALDGIIGGFINNFETILTGGLLLNMFLPGGIVGLLASIKGALAAAVAFIAGSVAATIGAVVAAVAVVGGILGIYMFGEGNSFTERLDDVFLKIRKLFGFIDAQDKRSAVQRKLDSIISSDNRRFADSGIAAQNGISSKQFDLSSIDFKALNEKQTANLEKLLVSVNDTLERTREEYLLTGQVSQSQMETLINATKQARQGIDRAGSFSSESLTGLLYRAMVEGQTRASENGFDRITRAIVEGFTTTAINISSSLASTISGLLRLGTNTNTKVANALPDSFKGGTIDTALRSLADIFTRKADEIDGQITFYQERAKELFGEKVSEVYIEAAKNIAGIDPDKLNTQQRTELVGAIKDWIAAIQAEKDSRGVKFFGTPNERDGQVQALRQDQLRRAELRVLDLSAGVRDLQERAAAAERLNNQIKALTNSLQGNKVAFEDSDLNLLDDMAREKVKYLTSELSALNEEINTVSTTAEKRRIQIQIEVKGQQIKDAIEDAASFSREGLIGASKRLAQKNSINLDDKIIDKASIKGLEIFYAKLQEINQKVSDAKDPVLDKYGSERRKGLIKEAELLKREALQTLISDLPLGARLEALGSDAGVTFSEGFLRGMSDKRAAQSIQIFQRLSKLAEERLQTESPTRLAQIDNESAKLKQFFNVPEPRIDTFNTILGDINALGANLSIQDFLSIDAATYKGLRNAAAEVRQIALILEQPGSENLTAKQLQAYAKAQTDAAERARKLLSNQPKSATEVSQLFSGSGFDFSVSRAFSLPPDTLTRYIDINRQITEIQLKLDNKNTDKALIPGLAKEQDTLKKTARGIIEDNLRVGEQLQFINSQYGDLNLSTEEFGRMTAENRTTLFNLATEARDLAEALKDVGSLDEASFQRRLKEIQLNKELAKGAAKVEAASPFEELAKNLGKANIGAQYEDILALTVDGARSINAQVLKFLAEWATAQNPNQPEDVRKAALATLEGLRTNILNGIVEANAAVRTAADIKQAGIDLANNTRESLKQGLSNALMSKGDVPFFRALFDTLTENIVNSFVNSFVDAITGKNNPNSIFNKAFEFLGSGVAKQGKDAADKVSGADKKSLITTVTEDLGKVYDVVTSTFGGILDKLTSLFGSIDFGSLFDSISSIFSSFQGFDLGGTLASAGSWLSSLLPFADGGVVPGALGAPMPVLAHGGEVILNDAQQRALLSGGTGRTEQVFNVNITGDVSRQTRQEIARLIPQIASGVNQHNYETGVRR